MKVPPLPAVGVPEVDPVSLGPDRIAQFHEQGFTWVEQITTPEEIEWLREVYDALFTERIAGFKGGYFDLARPYDAEGDDVLPQILFPERAVPELARTCFARNSRSLCSVLLGVEPDQLEMWGHMILKPARVGHVTPWHQDEAYWEPHLSYQAAGVWMPLDDVDESNGCMMFVPGSHRSAVLPHRHIGDDPSVHGLELISVPDVTGAVSVPLPAGGATFHHPRTIHSTNPNRTDRGRRAYANEWQTPPVAAAVVDDRPWVTAGREAMARRSLPN